MTGVQFLAGAMMEIHLFAIMSRLALGPPSLLSSGYLGLFPQGMKLTTHLHLVPQLRMYGTIPSFPHMSS